MRSLIEHNPATLRERGDLYLGDAGISSNVIAGLDSFAGTVLPADSSMM